jgi:hypothetical protein
VLIELGTAHLAVLAVVDLRRGERDANQMQHTDQDFY